MRLGSVVALAGLAASVALGLERGGNAWVSPAYGQPSSNDKAAAEALFDEGKKLIEAKSYAAACGKFEASLKLDPGIGTLLFLGECYERTDRFASAWATFREAAALAKVGNDPKREQIARDRADALEPKLFRLTVAVVERVPGLVVKRDGEPLSDATWGVGVPVDSGEHTIEASAEGYVSFKKVIQTPGAPGQETVAVPKLERDLTPVAPPSASAAPPASASVAPPPPPPPPEERGSGLLIGGLVVGGVGVIGMAVTGALLGVATSTYRDGDQFCDGTVCSDPRGVEAADDARALGDVGTGTLIGSLALLGTGAVLLVVHFASGPSAPDSTVQVGLAPRPGGAALGLWGRF